MVWCGGGTPEGMTNGLKAVATLGGTAEDTEAKVPQPVGRGRIADAV